MGLLVAVLASAMLAGATRAAAQDDLSGEWLLQASYLEGYTSSTTQNSSVFAVRCSQGPCSSWRTANLTILDSTGKVSVAFDSGVVHAGQAQSNGALVSSIKWTDNSVWLHALSGAMRIHLAPHSHTDPGWKDTLERLYENEVRAIYTDLVLATLANSTVRTFNAEITVFWQLWWEDPATSPAMRNTIHELVAAGRLEFTGGGWVQPDEATTRFEDLVDQFTLGHAWVNSAFYGAPVTPRPVTTGWSADPFGHSSTTAYLGTQMGWGGYVIGRPMQYLDGDTSNGDPINSQQAAIWHATASFPDGGAYDAHSLLIHDHPGYWTPHRPCQDALSKGDAVSVAQQLLTYSLALSLRPPAVANVLVMFGDDFTNPYEYLPTLEAALALINTQTVPGFLGLNATIEYSTVSRYFAVLNEELAAGAAAPAAGGAAAPTSASPLSTTGSTFPGFPSRGAEDMMPLIGGEFGAPWSGFYTSRPEFKTRFHAGSAVLRAAFQLHALARMDSWGADLTRLLKLWTSVGLVQHHDAITGDSFDNVMEDFSSRIMAGVSNCSEAMSSSVGALTQRFGGSGAAIAPTLCFNASSQSCDAITAALSSGSAALVTIFNPRAWAVELEPVELRLPTSAFAGLSIVASQTGEAAPCQFTLTPTADGSEAEYAVAFLASVPPLGLANFLVSPAASPAAGSCQFSAPQPVTQASSLSNSHLTLNYSSTGSVTGMHAAAAGSGAPVSIALGAAVLYYSSAGGSENAWDFSTDKAGPGGAAPFAGAPSQSSTLVVGSVFSELRTNIDPASGVSLRWRLYSAQRSVHVYTQSGPFPDAANPSGRSLDAILRLSSSIDSGHSFLSDSNGLELLNRTLDARPWSTKPFVDTDQPVSSNYYPLTAAAIIQDRGSGTTLVLNSALSSQGVGSLLPGSLEVGVNRMVLDSSKSRQTGNRRVTLHNSLTLAADPISAAGIMRPLDAALSNPLIIMAQARSDSSTVPAVVAPFADAAVWPPEVQLLSVQLLPARLNISGFMVGSGSRTPLSGSLVLVRLRHMLSRSEGGSPVTLNISQLFPPWLNVSGFTEQTLDGLVPMVAAQATRLQWQQAPAARGPGLVIPATPAAAAPNSRSSRLHGDALLTMNPMDIRTLILDLGE